MPTPRSWIIFEELVRWFMIRAGYRDVPVPGPGVRRGTAGVDIQGRGAWHQIDVPLTWPFWTPMTYPLVSLVEAKYYSSHVRLPHIRNALGVFTDISQNSFPVMGAAGNVISTRSRFQFQAVVCSASGFSSRAIDFALAHQIFLVDYAPFPLFRSWIRSFEDAHEEFIPRNEERPFREEVRRSLETGLIPGTKIDLRPVRCSVFGVLGGFYPVQFMSEVVTEQDLIQLGPRRCRVTYEEDLWTIVIAPGYALQFSLPIQLANALQRDGDGWRQRAQLKLETMRTIELLVPTHEGRNYMQIRLELDEDWLRRYIENRDNPK